MAATKAARKEPRPLSAVGVCNSLKAMQLCSFVSPENQAQQYGIIPFE